LEAIDKNGFIKQLGLELAKFPVEPKFAKALLAA
jgi:HrpA-like RNA helicase